MLPIADHNDCSLTNSGLSPPVEEETMMCAGGEGEGGCQVYVAQKKRMQLKFTDHCSDVVNALCT